MSERRRLPITGPSPVVRGAARNSSFLITFMRTATGARMTTEGVPRTRAVMLRGPRPV